MIVRTLLIVAALVSIAFGPDTARAAAARDLLVIDPGGPFTGASGELLLTAENGVQFHCFSATITGRFTTGGPLPGTIGVIESSTWNDCDGAAGWVRSLDQVGTWNIVAHSYHPDAGASGQVTGIITDVGFHLAGPGCSMNLAGNVDFVYDNASGTLATLPMSLTLTISFIDPVNNCFGLFEAGDGAMLDVSFAISPVQTMTSP